MLRIIIALLFILPVFSCAPKDEIRSTVKAKPGLSFKKFPILEYHKIGYPEGRWTRTPENFKSDLEWLRQNGFYPANLRDILTSFEGVPENKKPVVLTFDDSTSTQFRYLKDGKLDPQCAVGIIKDFQRKHSDWPLRATFFVVIETNDPDRNLFGQKEHPEYKVKKLRQLQGWGMEVGSHTYSHDCLSDISTPMARYQLARSSFALEKITGNKPVSLALPMGLYPKDGSVFSGQYHKIKYDFKLVCEVTGGLQEVPWTGDFDPRHIKRIQAIDEEWNKFFKRGKAINEGKKSKRSRSKRKQFR
jgi:peptidoglycan/xylan/chitin deacetylase (PgdA/CDA1 family)